MTWSLFSWRLPEFEYPSLHSDTRAFRVIKLLRPTTSRFPPFGQTLNIEVIETSVDNVSLQYDTLSYCWGVGKPDRQVIVSKTNDDDDGRENRNDRIIYISASLESALLSLAREENVGTCYPIFADQICINQADPVEKIQQVRLMGEIYARSARSIVWLGESTPETCRYFDISTELQSEAIMGRLKGFNWAQLSEISNAVMDSNVMLETEAKKKDRDDIVDLIMRYGQRWPVNGMAEVFRRAWMNRLWVVQEGCLPPEVIIRCGEKSLCFDCFRGSMLFNTIATTYWTRHTTEAVSQDELRTRHNINTLSEPFIRLFQERKAVHDPQKDRRSLYDLVLKYNVNDAAPKTGAKQPEDRIYALLGMANDDDVARETVEAMEMENMKGTYSKFAVSVMRKNPDVLLFSQTPKSLDGHKLPSWVPDWSAKRLLTPAGYSDPLTPIFSAGGSRSSHDISFDEQVSALRINAVQVGRVVRVGLRSLEPNPISTIASAEFISVRQFVEEIGEFIEAAKKMKSSKLPDMADDQLRLNLVIRLSDGGLSQKAYHTTFDQSSAQELLQEIHIKVLNFGKVLMDTEAISKTYSSIISVIRSKRVKPWYFSPGSEIDVVRLCAVNPIGAVQTLVTGLAFMVVDVVKAWYDSTKVRLNKVYIDYRHARTKKVLLHNPQRKKMIEGIGTDDILYSKEWRTYTCNLYKNIGRKLFLTDTGYLGLGPSHMEEDDEIIVIPGGSVPYILRPQGSSDFSNGVRASETWSYVGEAYCDGIMDGELVVGDNLDTRSFEIV
ncbi:hypothetical protein HD806DRAFT_515858 [Xylariaceae sp. AK1471]|nr:hypothetical protein HD806DRAFT_515858 [Xylariaceae sp. AK1471]